MRSIDRLLLAFLACTLALLTVPSSALAATPAGGAARTAPAPRALPSPMDATNTCASCHATLAEDKLRDPSKEFSHSAHRDPRIGCVGCHGGDPRDPTVGAHAATMGFRPHPTHAEIPQICGGCHGDAAFMRRLNGRLPVGQLALYSLSLHGRLTADGDTAAPDCSSCHGKHDILSPASPLSPVNRANVAEVCRGCHADRDRMARYGIATDQFYKWQRSVHGEAFRAGNPKAPTCTGCHGAHASAPPDASSVAHACGRCHEDEMKLFEESPHSQGFRTRGLAECVVCHGNHDVAWASALMVGTGPDATCMRCHAHDEKPRRVAEQIASSLGRARDRASEAREAVAQARERGLRIAGAAYALDRMATAETKVRSVVHTLDPARVEAEVGNIEQSAAEVRSLVAAGERDRSVERRAYYVALALAAMLLASLVLKARQLDRRRGRGVP